MQLSDLQIYENVQFSDFQICENVTDFLFFLTLERRESISLIMLCAKLCSVPTNNLFLWSHLKDNINRSWRFMQKITPSHLRSREVCVLVSFPIYSFFILCHHHCPSYNHVILLHCIRMLTRHLPCPLQIVFHFYPGKIRFSDVCEHFPWFESSSDFFFTASLSVFHH